MPGFEGEWYEKFRRGKSPTRGSLIDSFRLMLEWTVQNDPDRMIGLMRENLGMTVGLNKSDLRNLLNFVPANSSLPGWFTFFRAGLLDEGYGKAEEDFQTVLTASQASGDLLLGVQTAAQLCICATLQNRYLQATRYAEICSTLAQKSGDLTNLPTAIQIEAMAMLTHGRASEGFIQLERAENHYRVHLDAVMMRALRGYYLSTYGRITEADKVLEIPRKVRDETGHGVLKMICSLADARILARDLDRRETVNVYEKVTALSENFSDRRFTVVSNEELALAYLRLGDVPLAKQRAVQAKKLRKSMAMTYTPWDQMRLS